MNKPLVIRAMWLALAMACVFCTPEIGMSEPVLVSLRATETPVAAVVATAVEGPAETKTSDRAAPAVSAESKIPAQNQAGVKRKDVGAATSDAHPKAGAAAPVDVDEKTVVATIADWNITGKELRARVYRESYPDPYDMTPRIAPVDVHDVVFLLLGEKALAMEAHKQGQQKEGTVASSLERYRTSLLINKLMSQVIKEKDVQVTEKEVKAYQKIKPKLDDARARTTLMRLKAQKLANDYITKLRISRHVRTRKENFAKVAAMHQRLLLHPKEPRTNNVSWILRKQIQNELTAKQKKLVMATYDGGIFTAEDWFMALHQIAPPGRPKNLATLAGVASFLDRSIRQPLLRAEAIERGLNKDSEFIKLVRAREYTMLYSKIRSDTIKAVAEPNDQEITARYAAIKDTFGRNDSVKALLIWCENRKAAAQARAELDAGQAFDKVQAKYSLDKKNLAARDLTLHQEGMFWQKIWASEPNQILGPILGFYDGGFKWRIIKTLEKQSKDPKALDDNLKRTLQWEIRNDRVEAQLRDRMKKLLQTYPHKIFKERLKAYDPARTP